MNDDVDLTTVFEFTKLLTRHFIFVVCDDMDWVCR